MAVKIRLARRGRKKLAKYDVVVADVRAPRDGRFIEKLGTYNPNTNPATIDINEDRAFDWVMKGAQPTDTVRAILSYRGVMLRKHLQIGVNKGAITQEEADKKLEAWLKEKESRIAAKVDKLQQTKESKDKERLAAERKVKEARAEAIRGKSVVAATAASGAEGEEAPVSQTGESKVEESATEPAVEASAATAAAETGQSTATEEAPVEESPAEEPSVAEPTAEEAPDAEESSQQEEE